MYVASFKTNLKLLQQQAVLGNFTHFHSFQPRQQTSRPHHRVIITWIFEALIHSFNCLFYTCNSADNRYTVCRHLCCPNCVTKLSAGNYYHDAMRADFRDTTLLDCNKSVFQPHLSMLRTMCLLTQPCLEATLEASQKPHTELCNGCVQCMLFDLSKSLKRMWN